MDQFGGFSTCGSVTALVLSNVGECERWGVFCKLDSRRSRKHDPFPERIMRREEFESRSGGHCEDLDHSIIIKFQSIAKLIFSGLLQGVWSLRVGICLVV